MSQQPESCKLTKRQTASQLDRLTCPTWSEQTFEKWELPLAYPLVTPG